MKNQQMVRGEPPIRKGRSGDGGSCSTVGKGDRAASGPGLARLLLSRRGARAGAAQKHPGISKGMVTPGRHEPQTPCQPGYGDEINCTPPETSKPEPCGAASPLTNLTGEAAGRLAASLPHARSSQQAQPPPAAAPLSGVLHVPNS